MNEAVAPATAAAAAVLRPAGLTLPAERIEIKLFVGRLPTTVREEDILPLFSTFGDVVEVAIIRDKLTGAHKGSCFVRMASITQADAAVRALNNQKVIHNASGPMQISYAAGEAARLGFTPGSLVPGEDEAKVFVGSLPRDVTKEKVETFFSQYGKAYDCFLMKEPETGQFRGCCFVKFSLKENALLAVKRLHGLVTFPGSTRPLEVRIAEPKRLNGLSPPSNRFSPSIQSACTPSFPAAATTQQYPGSSPLLSPSLTGADLSCQAAAWGAVAQNYRQSQQQFVNSLYLNANPRTAGQWKEYFTPDGRPYYHNELCGLTQWEAPLEFLSYWSPLQQPQLAAPRAAMTNTTALPRVSPAAAAAAFPLLPPSSSSGAGEQHSLCVFGPPGANVFIFHLPSDWTGEQLVQLFSKYGTILSAKVAADPPTGRNKGYGFVSFDSVASAIAAVEGVNLLSVGKKRLRVAIKDGEEDKAKEYARAHGLVFDPPPERKRNNGPRRSSKSGHADFQQPTFPSTSYAGDVGVTSTTNSPAEGPPQAAAV